MQELRSELDAHSEAVNVLCEASPVLVANCSSSDKLLVQTELAGVTSQWADIEKAWNKREAEMGDVKETATQYHNTHDPLLAKLTDLEQRLIDQPPVGTELDIVKEQLQEQKVTGMCLANESRFVDLMLVSPTCRLNKSEVN